MDCNPDGSTIRVKRVAAMDKPPGFVPVRFHIMGKIILTVGILGWILSGLSFITGWIDLPAVTPWVSSASVLIGLYLIYLVPRE